MTTIIVAIVVAVAAAIGVVLFLKANKNKAAVINATVDKAGAAIDKATGGKL